MGVTAVTRDMSRGGGSPRFSQQKLFLIFAGEPRGSAPPPGHVSCHSGFNRQLESLGQELAAWGRAPAPAAQRAGTSASGGRNGVCVAASRQLPALRAALRAAECTDRVQTLQRHLCHMSVQAPAPAPSIGLVWIVNRNRSVRCGIAVVPTHLGRRSNCIAEAKIPQQVICT